MRDICATCGRDWALHWVAQMMTAAERMAIRPEARTCASFVPKIKPPRRPRRPNMPLTPWWVLKIMRHGKPLGLTSAFRQMVREYRREIYDPRERRRWNEGWAVIDPASAEAIERDEVDWRWFPDAEPPRGQTWRPSPEMRKAMREHAKQYSRRKRDGQQAANR